MKKIIDRIKSLLNQKRVHNDYIIIGIGGPGGTGKSTFARRLSSEFNNSQVLSTDDYRFSRKSRNESGLKGSNPEANKLDLLIQHLKNIKSGINFQKPVYNHIDGTDDEFEEFTLGDITICEGELVLHDRVTELIDILIYLDSDPETQLNSRLNRDLKNKNLSRIEIEKLYYESNILDFERYYLHNKTKADILVFVNGKYEYSLIK